MLVKGNNFNSRILIMSYNDCSQWESPSRSSWLVLGHNSYSLYRFSLLLWSVQSCRQPVSNKNILSLHEHLMSYYKIAKCTVACNIYQWIHSSSIRAKVSSVLINWSPKRLLGHFLRTFCFYLHVILTLTLVKIFITPYIQFWKPFRSCNCFM